MNNGKQIAEIILSQLGGVGKLSAMIEANYFTYSSEGAFLQFDFLMCKFANRVKIELNGSDLYDITFYNYNNRNGTLKTVQTYEDIYAEDLRDIFESFTGLYLSLSFFN